MAHVTTLEVLILRSLRELGILWVNKENVRELRL